MEMSKKFKLKFDWKKWSHYLALADPWVGASPSVAERCRVVAVMWVAVVAEFDDFAMR